MRSKEMDPDKMKERVSDLELARAERSRDQILKSLQVLTE